MARFSRLDTLVVTLRSGLMPLFFNPDASTAIRLVEALDAAGVRVIEFTNRGDGAHLVFAELEQECRRRMPDIVLGVGSVLDAGTASMYLNLGASFVVSPTLSAEVAAVCNRRKVAYMPGCATPTEVARAEELGCEIVKLFPARLGGPQLISDLLAPCPWSRIMPTGGIAPDRESLTSWFGAGAACVGMGSQLFPAAEVHGGSLGGDHRARQDHPRPHRRVSPLRSRKPGREHRVDVVSLAIKRPDEARWDCVALGEVMLRLDPGRHAHPHCPHVRRVGRRRRVQRRPRPAAAASACAPPSSRRSSTTTSDGSSRRSIHAGRRGHPPRLLGSASTASAARRESASTSRSEASELRPARTVYDRGHTAAAAMKPGDVDWRRLFEVEGVRWLHTGGIFAALSPSTAEVLLEALDAAKAAGTVVSYDLNFRAGLWASQGGRDRAIEVNRAARPLRRRDARQRGGLQRRPRLRRSAASTRTCPNSTRRTSRR